MNVDQYTEVRFASFLSDGFNTATVVNLLELLLLLLLFGAMMLKRHGPATIGAVHVFFSKLWILYMIYP